MVEDEKFFAWLDGELPPEEAARVAAEVAADPERSRLADDHRAMAAGLRGAFGSVLAQPVPTHLQELVGGNADVISLSEARSRRAAAQGQPLWVQAAALAATLAIGIFAGSQLTGGSPSPVRPEAGRLIASAELDTALSTRLAGTPADSGPRIGLTFREKSGAICRTFEDQWANGLACREGDDWRIRSLFQAPEGQAATYRMASGPDPQLMEAVDAAIDGEAFDTPQEKAVMERGWRD